MQHITLERPGVGTLLGAQYKVKEEFVAASGFVVDVKGPTVVNPEKQRYKNPHFETTLWVGFTLRGDDGSITPVSLFTDQPGAAKLAHDIVSGKAFQVGDYVTVFGISEPARDLQGNIRSRFKLNPKYPIQKGGLPTESTTPVEKDALTQLAEMAALDAVTEGETFAQQTETPALNDDFPG